MIDRKITSTRTIPTPGPWKARTSFAYPSKEDDDGEMMSYACSVDCHAPYTDDVPESDHYGRTFDEQAVARVYGRTKEEMVANAALIAAVPRMLSIIEKLQAWPPGYEQDGLLPTFAA